MKRSALGFTLIELSIVLVIIGLLVGGVLSGQELIYAARLRKVGSELQQYQTAVTTFRVKYDCLPGDCANITSVFGADSTCPNGGGTSGTCNGNGDGYVNGWWVHGLPLEALFTWQQLSLAHLIPGSWPGGGGEGINVVPGVNVPSSSFDPNIGYHMFTADPGLIYMDGLPETLVLQIGELNAGTPYDFMWGAGFTAPQAYGLDMKFDDGNPNSGQLLGTNPWSVGTDNTNLTCVTATAYETGVATGCTLYFTFKL